MSLNLKAKLRIIERGGAYFLQEKRFFKWVDCISFAGILNEPFPFTSTESITNVVKDEIWWQIIRETRKHDNKLFIREDEYRKHNSIEKR